MNQIKGIREDIFLAAWAVSQGYTFDVPAAKFSEATGVPHESLRFSRANSDVHVWETARGWRVARKNAEGIFPREEVTPESFHDSLFEALKHGRQL